MSQHDTPPPAPLLPLHATVLDAEGRPLQVRRRPGRPRKIKPAPEVSEIDYIETLNEGRRGHIATDLLVRAVQLEDPRQVIAQAEIGLASEAASLLFEIERGQTRGTDVAQLHSRRIDALVKLGSIVLGRRKLFGDDLDGDLPKIRDYFVEAVATVLRQTLDAPRAEMLIGEIRRRLDASLSSTPL